MAEFTHRCPDRYRGDNELTDYWRDDDSCSYCGSLNPKTFMERVRAGNVRLEPTDKSYKVYVQNIDGPAFKQTYRNCSASVCTEGPDKCTHWVTRDTPSTKFYFAHLNEDQALEFVHLYNEKVLKFAYPGYFYVWPYFFGPAQAESETDN